MRITRRQFLAGSACAGTALFLTTFVDGRRVVRAVPIPGGTLDPEDIAKFTTPMLIPPVMPRAGTKPMMGGKPVDLYEISVRQFAQQILPAGMAGDDGLGLRVGQRSGAAGTRCLSTTRPRSRSRRSTIARSRSSGSMSWSDPAGEYLPHLLPVDPTLHWANPPGGIAGRDTRPAVR